MIVWKSVEECETRLTHRLLGHLAAVGADLSRRFGPPGLEIWRRLGQVGPHV